MQSERFWLSETTLLVSVWYCFLSQRVGRGCDFRKFHLSRSLLVRSYLLCETRRPIRTAGPSSCYPEMTISCRSRCLRGRAAKLQARPESTSDKRAATNLWNRCLLVIGCAAFTFSLSKPFILVTEYQLSGDIRSTSSVLRLQGSGLSSFRCAKRTCRISSGTLAQPTPPSPKQD